VPSHHKDVIRANDFVADREKDNGNMGVEIQENILYYKE
jgi:hypothetical protein